MLHKNKAESLGTSLSTLYFPKYDVLMHAQQARHVLIMKKEIPYKKNVGESGFNSS